MNGRLHRFWDEAVHEGVGSTLGRKRACMDNSKVIGDEHSKKIERAARSRRLALRLRDRKDVEPVEDMQEGVGVCKVDLARKDQIRSGAPM